MTIHTVLASCLILLSISITTAFTTVQPRRRISATTTKLTDTTIVSPFDETESEVGTTTTATLEGPLDLTWDNVELVLDEMRHFLIQDGGNVIISEIDGPVVRLELQVRKRYNVITDVRSFVLFVCSFIYLCYHYESFLNYSYPFCLMAETLLPFVLFYFVISDLQFLKINYCKYLMIASMQLLTYILIYLGRTR